MDKYEDMYNTICRVCLTLNNTQNMVSLTENSSVQGLSCFGKAITILTSVSLQSDDKLPTMICQTCVFLLKQAIYFKLKCESTNQKLKRLVNFNSNKVAAEVNIKEIVCEYVMFNHYFHEENKLENKLEALSIVSKHENEIKPSEYCHKNDQKNSRQNVKMVTNNVDNIYDFDDNITNEDSSNNNKTQSNEEIDNYLDAMQQIIKYESNIVVNCKKPQKRRHIYIPVSKSVNNTEKLYRLSKRTYIQRINDRNIQCKLCNKVLANRLTYKHHTERHNINDCKYICDKCGKGFPVLTELDRHQVTRHGIGPYLLCDHCQYKAPRKLDLIEHMRLHTGERPFTCEKCGLTFRRRAIWRNHVVRHMEKKVECVYCSKKFFTRHQMLEHRNNIHERMYMYMCSVCNITYTKNMTVRRHMLLKHGVPRERQGKIPKIMNARNETEK